jgi:hypothetical protein
MGVWVKLENQSVNSGIKLSTMFGWISPFLEAESDSRFTPAIDFQVLYHPPTKTNKDQLK